MTWFIFIFKQPNPLIPFIVIAVIAGILSALLRFLSENWGIISFVISSIITAVVIIRSIVKNVKGDESLLGNAKAHGIVFSSFWWVGTFLLLLAGHLLRPVIIVNPDEIELGLAVIFCVFGIISGVIIGWRKASESCDGAVESAGAGAIGSAIIIIGIFLIATVLGYTEIVKGLLIWGLVAITAAVAGAILGAILGAIGSVFKIGGALIGSLLGIIGGGGLGAFIGVLINGMLKSTIGSIGAVMLIISCSYSLYNSFSPENNTTNGKGRGVCLFLLLLVALSVLVLPRLIPYFPSLD